jgi:DNA-binding transcriptional LysR family regulator
MNLRQLEAFKATMRAGSITGAARALHISQPSVSRLIADLERSLGFPLFRKAGRGIVATVEARRFHQAIEAMFIGMDRLQDLADTLRSTAGGAVSLGIIPAFSHTIVPDAIRDFCRERPEVRIMTAIRNTPAIVDAVQMRQFDLGIVGRSPPYEGVELLHHVSVPYVCLVPSGHRLARQRGPFDLEELAERETFVTFGGVYPDEMLEIDSALSARLNEKARLFAANMPIAASLARATGSLAIVDPYTARIEEKLGGVVSRPIRQALTYHIAVIGPAPGALTLAASKLAEVLIARLEESAR